MTLAPSFRSVASLALEAERFEVASHGGTTVWRRWGQGPSNVVLLHGGSGSWRHWCRNIDVLARTHTVWVPDIAGFGESSLPEEGPLSVASLARGLCEGLEKLSNGGCEQLDVVGFSLGAGVAAQFAQAWRGSVRSLVLVGCNVIGLAPTRMPGLMAPRRIADPTLRRQAYRHNLALMMFSDAAQIDDTILDVYIADSEMRTMPFDVLDVDVYQFAQLGTLRLGHGLFSISGEQDALVPPPADQQRALSDLHPGSEHHVIPGAAHWVMYEAASHFNHLVSGFLAQGRAKA